MSDRKSDESRGLFDTLFAAFGKAIADIRHKVVEEGWFGRATTREPLDQQRSFYRPVMPERAASFDDLYGPRARAPEGDEREREQSRGIDL